MRETAEVDLEAEAYEAVPKLVAKRDWGLEASRTVSNNPSLVSLLGPLVS